MRKHLFLSGMLLLALAPLAAQHVDAGDLEAHVSFLASDEMLGRGFGTEQGDIAARYVAAHFDAAGIAPLLDDYFHRFNYRTGSLNISGKNVVGVIHGTDPDLKDEYIVVGAHYDHIGWRLEDNDTIVYNGADDNASGTASVIEIGKYLAKHRDALKRSVVLVAFDGEETGLIGSRQFVEDSILPPGKIKAMFSLDMLGMFDTHGGVDLHGMKAIRESDVFITEAMEKADIGGIHANEDKPGSTDSAPFFEIGIPGVHVFTGLESPYHEPEDDSDLLEYESMATLNDFLIELFIIMSGAPEITPGKSMESVQSGKLLRIFHPGLRVNMGGSHHNYPEEFFKANGVFAGGAGVFLQTRINQFLAIQPEVLYELQGSQHEQGTLRTHSVTAPLSLMVTTPDPSYTGFRSFLQLGGYYSYAFHGTIDGNSFEFGNTFNDREYGVLFGIGVEAEFMRVSVVMKRAISDFTAESAVPVKPVATFYSLGFVF